MGKGNLVQGFGRGKLGDTVYYRINGEQAFRARNRRPHNPRSNKQLVQRAIMATVMAAYSAGKEIFDHSFQGYSVGAGNQRRFMKLNADALRRAISREWGTTAYEEALAKVTAPGVQTPIPNEYIISEGSLTQNLFVLDDDPTVPAWGLPAFNTNEKVNEYAARIGINAGDIYTVVYFTTSQEPADVLFRTYGIASVDFDTVYRGSFGWLRLIAKNLASNSDAMTNATLMSTLFDIEQGGVSTFPAATAPYSTMLQIETIDVTHPAAMDNGYAIGLIKSRRDEDLRSNATMIVANPSEFGLAWGDILEAWKSGTTQIGDSDLILEGGDE